MKKQLAKISLQRLFRHGSRSFSLHIVCSSEVPAANHHRGDSFGGQCRYEPSPNILAIQVRKLRNVKTIMMPQRSPDGLKTLHFSPILPITSRLLITYRAGVFHNVTLHEKKC